MPRRPDPPARTVAAFTLTVWPNGLTHSQLAGELDRVAKLVRQGYYSGEITSEANDGGWWNTDTPDA